MSSIDKQAERLGYTIRRGSYSGTTDNRIDRWYIESVDAWAVGRAGSGFATKGDAFNYLKQAIRDYPDSPAIHTYNLAPTD